jgi:hypothetical protein
MKYLISLMFTLFLCSFCFPQQKETRNELKHSVGLEFSPFQFTVWRYDFEVSEAWSEEPKALNATLFSQSGISYEYKLRAFLKIRSGITYGHEKNDFAVVTRKNEYLSLNYSVYYLSLPLGIRLNPFNIKDQDSNGKLFAQINTDIDMTTREDVILKSQEFIDPRYPKPPGYIVSPASSEEMHSSHIQFNRIRPALILGYEIEGKHLSFSYGFRISFPAIHKINSINGISRNTGINPAIISLNYRF